MYYKLLSFLLAIGVSSLGFSQSSRDSVNVRSGYIAVSIGPAFPVGEFSSNNLNDDRAGFAETGLNLGVINWGYRFKYIELAARLMGAAHFLNLGTNTARPDAAWVYSGIFAGAVIPFDITRRLQIGGRVMLGYLAITSPEVAAEGVVLAEQNWGGLGFTRGVNIRYNVFPRWCALADIYYLTANPKFNNYAPKLKVINTSFGIGYRLK